MSRRVVVNRDVCIGAESCVAEFQSAFSLADDGRVLPLPGLEDLSDQDREAAVAGCPSGALIMEPDDA